MDVGKFTRRILKISTAKVRKERNGRERIGKERE